MRRQSEVVFSVRRDSLATVHSEIKFILNFMYLIVSLQVRQLLGSFRTNFRISVVDYLHHETKIKFETFARRCMSPTAGSGSFILKLINNL